MRSEKDVVEALFHESPGHLGLRNLFGEELLRILKQVATLRRSDLEAMAKTLRAEYQDRDPPAESSGRGAHTPGAAPIREQFVKRAIAAIRKWLRENVPGFKKLKLSDSEIIENYLLPARRFVEGTAEKRKGRDWLANSAASNRGSLKPRRPLTLRQC